ncbi:hypothetical protein [Aeromicrobium sp. Leaf350]|uniref:hypothetical protein n=1 Tax=Aeromicrobium sp. Leaf350 TaxID=2876565 RepID=UPI001E5E1876|nr:hypothetical protein [Aeromicrobium sp. Leaf350]
MRIQDRPIRTIHDLTRVWRFIDGDLGYDAPQLFALVVDRRDRVIPTVIQVYDTEHDGGLDRDVMEKFLAAHAEVIRTEHPGGSLALMRARPGQSALTDDDRAWCRMTHELLVAAPFASRPLFFATDRSCGVVPPDALASEVG